MTKNKQIILVIIGIVILLFYMNQSKEKEFKKGTEQPLIITDLTNINLDGLTNQSYGNGEDVIFDVRKVGSFGTKGQIYLDDRIYYDGTENSTNSVLIYISRDFSPVIDLRQGDYITLTYDSKNIKIYFPLYQSATSTYFYPSSTGETYHDSALTSPACTILNGCIETPYSNFINFKNLYLSGSDILPTFISNANQWVIS